MHKKGHKIPHDFLPSFGNKNNKKHARTSSLGFSFQCVLPFDNQTRNCESSLHIPNYSSPLSFSVHCAFIRKVLRYIFLTVDWICEENVDSQQQAPSACDEQVGSCSVCSHSGDFHHSEHHGNVCSAAIKC